MTDHLGTVATRSMQLWLRVGRADARLAGARRHRERVPGRVPHLRRDVGAARRGSVAGRRPTRGRSATSATCTPTGPIRRPPTTSGYPGREHARLRAEAIEFLRRRRAPPLAAAGADGDFRWDLLCGSRATADDEPRLDGQYLRANVDPSDRYVLSLPGTGRYRLRADASGYEQPLARGRLDRLRPQRRLHRGGGRVGHPGRERGARSPAASTGVAGYYQTHRRVATAPSGPSEPTTSARP